MYRNTVDYVTQRFPERTLLVRSDGDVRYVILKTWHQVSLVALLVACLIWTVGVNIGLFISQSALNDVKSELQIAIDQNREFINALETDQKHVHELRMRFEAEQQKTKRLVAEFEAIRSVAEDLLGSEAPKTPLRFSMWLDGQLADRIRTVDAENDGLSALLTNMAVSIGQIAGEAPPTDTTEIPNWFVETSDLIAQSYASQIAAMESLRSTLSGALSTHYELIEQTPLADPEVLGVGWSPLNAIGGPESTSHESDSLFEQFGQRAEDLLAFSDDLDRLNKLLQCTPFAAPVDYYNLTSAFGTRRDPFTKRKAWHDGVDLGAWPGTKVKSTAAGIVTHAGVKGGFGRLVVIDHGCGIETLYGHLKSITVKKGQVVGHRDVLGTVGSTGRSTGPHVHYEIRIHDKAVDPYQFIEAGRNVFKAKDSTIARIEPAID